jgi:hypothetical protein
METKEGQKSRGNIPLINGAPGGKPGRRGNGRLYSKKRGHQREVKSLRLQEVKLPSPGVRAV